MRSDIIRAGGAHRLSDHRGMGRFPLVLAGWHNSRVALASDEGNAVLRQRLCAHPECRSVFTICVSCDRGQRYCGLACRSEARRRQHRAANRRYQQSQPGRESHRRCQQRYRERVAPVSVTDQGVTTITSTVPSPPATLCRCAICGRNSRWIDPFPVLPRPWRRGGRSKNYVFR